jgi:hypothetical protein
MQPLDPAARRAKLAEVMATANPQAMAVIRTMEGMRQHEADQAAAREEKGFDRQLRREGQMVHAGEVLATQANTLQMKMMQLAQDERAGIRNDELRRDVQASQEQYKKDQLEFQKMKLESEAEDRKQREKAAADLQRELAAGRNQTSKDIAAMRQGKGAAMSATAQKELFEADDTIAATKNVISALDRAMELSPKAFEGATAGMRAGALGYVPGKFEGEDATVELDNIVRSQAVEQLKAIFGGMPTEGERKILMELQGSVNLKNQQRQAIYQRAKELAQRRLDVNQQKAKQLREGTYFSEQGGTGTSQPSIPSGALKGGPMLGTVEDGYKYKGGDPANPKNWEKVK